MRLIMVFFLMIRRPPRSTLFPTRRSSDLGDEGAVRRLVGGVGERHDVLAERCSASLVQPLGGGVRRAVVVEQEVRERRRRSEEHTSELQSRQYIVCRLLLEKKTLPHR